MKSIYIICIVLSVLSLVNAAKDPHKRKLLLASKLKAEAVLQKLEKEEARSDAESGVSVTDKKLNVTNSVGSKVNGTGATSSDDLLSDDFSEKDDGSVEVESHKETGLTAKPRPGLTYLGQIRQLLLQFFQLIGLSNPTPTEKRKNRGMVVEENSILDNPEFREDLKSTLGAVMGRPECLKNVACRAGKYLKSMRGKEVLIVVLEKITPNKWTETFRMVKDSAFHSGNCESKCLKD